MRINFITIDSVNLNNKLTDIHISNFEKIIRNSSKILEETDSNKKTSTEVIAFFDLVGSTSLKLKEGHEAGTRMMRFHNSICLSFVEELGGIVVKEVGDGILARFNDPIKACQAAINIRDAAKLKKCSTKAALVLGIVEENQFQNNFDVLGAAVDLCSRIEKHAFPDQILIDGALYSAVKTYLKKYDVITSHPLTTIIDDNKIDLYEITSKNYKLKGMLNIPLFIHAEGMLSIEEKVSFMKTAKSEVIELGHGLHTFSDYFHSRNPTEFKNPVKELLEKNVSFKCVALDPNWAFTNLHFINENEKKYIEQIPLSLMKLKNFKDECKREKLKGAFEILVYQHHPLFHAVCVDADSNEGKIIISNYLYGVEKSECPVFYFSKISNPELFDKYFKSINMIVNESKPWN